MPRIGLTVRFRPCARLAVRRDFAEFHNGFLYVPERPVDRFGVGERFGDVMVEQNDVRALLVSGEEPTPHAFAEVVFARHFIIFVHIASPQNGTKNVSKPLRRKPV